eukprot:8173070-Alexandrium_andersonii.AAC.1
MSASLVGSEMCIRDSRCHATTANVSIDATASITLGFSPHAGPCVKMEWPRWRSACFDGGPRVSMEARVF